MITVKLTYCTCSTTVTFNFILKEILYPTHSHVFAELLDGPSMEEETVCLQQSRNNTVTMVISNNCIRLRQLQHHIIIDNTTFSNINRVSLSGLGRLLKCHQIRMKQLYRVPFERYSDRVKQLRYEYVQVSYTILSLVLYSSLLCYILTALCLFILSYKNVVSCLFQRVVELDTAAEHHDFVYIDEVGFNLGKTRRRGRNLIGHGAIVNVPGQCGGKITMCAAISQNGVHHHATLGPYNTTHIISFLDTLHNILIPNNQRKGPEQSRFVVILHNVSFNLVSSCFGPQLVY